MKKACLIHWRETEAREYIAQLKKLQYNVIYQEIMDPAYLKKLKSSPPDILIIDLSRLPSHGREIGLIFRETKSTRSIPVIFMEGKPDKVEKTKEYLPDAVYSSWYKLENAIETAYVKSKFEPAAKKNRMDHYKGNPLFKKLGIKPGYRVKLLNAPNDIESVFDELPENVEFLYDDKRTADLSLVFINSQFDLLNRIEQVKKLSKESPVWIAWAKQSSSVKTDVTQPFIRDVCTENNLVDYKVCSISKVWSGLLFKYRDISNSKM